MLHKINWECEKCKIEPVNLRPHCSCVNALKKEKRCHLWIPRAVETHSCLYCSEACLECIFISCLRTPTVPICSPALLSSSTAASCVVTVPCFIHSPAVTLCSPGISISCSLVSSLLHHQWQQQQHPCSLHLVFPCLLESREQRSAKGNCQV